MFYIFRVIINVPSKYPHRLSYSKPNYFKFCCKYSSHIFMSSFTSSYVVSFCLLYLFYISKCFNVTAHNFIVRDSGVFIPESFYNSWLLNYIESDFVMRFFTCGRLKYALINSSWLIKEAKGIPPKIMLTPVCMYLYSSCGSIRLYRWTTYTSYSMHLITSVIYNGGLYRRVSWLYLSWMIRAISWPVRKNKSFLI